VPVFVVPWKFRKFRTFNRRRGSSGQHKGRCTGLTRPAP
jgi:hypothetical protein